MKCPVCQAKLLPVAGELFCLQCGHAVHDGHVGDDQLTVQETVDPILQRAIRDAGDDTVVFSGAETVRAPDDPVGFLESPAMPQADKPVPAATDPSLVGSPAAAVPAEASAAPALEPKPEAAPVTIPAPAVAPEAKPAPDPVPVMTPALAGGSVGGGSAGGWGMALPIGRTLHPLTSAHSLFRPWLIGLAGMAVFVGLNLAAMNYYAQRVYPGVKVGDTAVGGLTFAELHTRLPKLLKPPALTVSVDGQRLDVQVSGAQAATTQSLERQARDVGRSVKLPLAAIIGSWFTGRVNPQYGLTTAEVDQAVAKLSAGVDRAPSDAKVIVMGSTVLPLAEKPGAELDRSVAAATIKASYGRTQAVSVKAKALAPAITTADYAHEVEAAQAMIGLGVQLTVKKAHYAPTPAQIGSWLVVKGPGQGVVADPAAVAAYVATVPGSYDRVAAVAAILGAVNARQPLNLTVSAKPVTATPQPASVAVAGPVASYTYCLAAAGSVSGAQFASVAGAALANGAAWTLGNRIHFVLSEQNCNVRLTLGSAGALSQLDPACGKQDSCRIHNDLGISEAVWNQPPASWTGDVHGYQVELINHVIGQWLGFEHPGCTAGTDQKPLLSAPSVVIPGCSPNWYAVPPEVQDTKVLPGL